MATGSGIPQSQAIVTADITPSYSVPHDTAIADAVGGAVGVAQEAVHGLIKQHYEQVGAQEGADVAAGLKPYKDIPVITDVGRARQAAFQGAYLAGVKTDIDNHIDQSARDNALNPDAFKKDADSIVAGYAKGAPGPFAVQVQQYAAERAATHYNSISGQKTQHDQQTSVNGVNARQQTLSDDMLSMAGAGQETSPAYAAAHAEWTANEASKVANPLFNYAPEQAAAAADKQVEQQQGAVLTHHATLSYSDAGGGEAGKAAALATMKREALDDGGALSGMTPGQRLKLYGVAVANINALDRDDAERRSIAAEQVRQDHVQKVENAGTMALGLTDGSETEKSVHQAEVDGRIEPGAAARLIQSARAQARRQAAEGRMAATAERTATYGAMSELAADGKLTAADLAANGGSLTPLQRLAVKARIDKVTGPGVANITGLAATSMRDNGITGATAKVVQENLKVDAAQFMSTNPTATVGQQQAFAADWMKKAKGLVITTSMGSAGTVQTKDQYTAAYRAKFHGQNVPQADVEAGWSRYKATHPTAH